MKRKKSHRSKKLMQAKVAHEKFLKSMGVPTIRPQMVYEFPDLSSKKSLIPTSDTIPSNGFRKSLDDYKWKAGAQEKEEAIREAEKKRTRVAPAYNKGPLMFITDEADPNSLGKKI